MRTETLKALLTDVKKGRKSVDEALAMIKTLPFIDVGFAKYDTHRDLRQGFPEVIFGSGKTREQIVTLCRVAMEHGNIVMVTRIDEKTANYVKKQIKGLTYHAHAHILSSGSIEPKKDGILILTAGTADMPVAEEAKVTAEVLGNNVDTAYDVGVAGLHRLLSQLDKLNKARVIIVVAGMDGALPSVVGGIVGKPVIAVPVSSGYGAGFKGLSSLLTMLNSCSPTVSVVNIDNGFGAGFIASLINRL
ncbi:MAG: nickel pincer cofactor biosynthesis protein LarB [bacterium]